MFISILFLCKLLVISLSAGLYIPYGVNGKRHRKRYRQHKIQDNHPRSIYTKKRTAARRKHFSVQGYQYEGKQIYPQDKAAQLISQFRAYQSRMPCGKLTYPASRFSPETEIIFINTCQRYQGKPQQLTKAEKVL